MAENLPARERDSDAPMGSEPADSLRAAPGDARLSKHTRLDLELAFPGPQVGEREL